MRERLWSGKTLLLCLVVVAALTASSADGGTNPKVYGKTFGEWSAAWWQWYAPIPPEEHPVNDPTGELCHVGQGGKVWFLAGNFEGANVVRTCEVPNGKALLFPFLDAIWWAPDDAETLEELRWLAKESMDGAANLSCTFDDRPCVFDQLYVRTQSPGFAFEGGEVLGLEGGRDLAVSDGHWVLLPPPSKGEHVLHFYGELISGPWEGFTIDQTYILIID